MTNEQMNSLLSAVLEKLTKRDLLEACLQSMPKNMLVELLMDSAPEAVPEAEKPQKTIPIRHNKGDKLEIAKTLAKGYIEKNIVFTRKDLGIQTAHLPTVEKFEDWLTTQNVEIGLVPLLTGKNMRVYTPFYWENGVKIMAATAGKRDKDIIKGAGFRPVISRESA